MVLIDPKNRSGRNNDEDIHKSSEPDTMHVDRQEEEEIDSEDLEDDDVLDHEEESEDGDDL